MTVTARLRACLLLALAGVGLLAWSLPAGAAPSTRIVDDGWWWRLQTGVLVEVPPPPGVEDDQLLVQSTPEGAQAIAAVSAELADGETNPVLALDVASAAGGEAAVILACQAGAAWTGTHAGRWDGKPAADCSTSVTGQLSEDGAQWVFPLGSLQFNDKLNVVLTPGLLADSDTPASFSVVFEAPTAASITTVAGETPPATVPPTSPPTIQPAAADDASPPVTSAPTSVVPARPALAAEDQGITATAPVVNEATAPTPIAATPLEDATEPRTLARVVGLAVLATAMAGALGVWRSALAGAPTATAEAPVAGGLARFRSERTSEPPPVS